MMDGRFTLVDFVRESNRIEGILREPTADEIAAHAVLLKLPALKVGHIETFVSVCAGPRHVLRDRVGLNVRVGDHIAPPGGPAIRAELEAILEAVRIGADAWKTHCQYEALHPFSDGNGRSGRVIWLWMMNHGTGHQRCQANALGFLHTFYYQTLSRVRL